MLVGLFLKKKSLKIYVNAEETETVSHYLPASEYFSSVFVCFSVLGLAFLNAVKGFLIESEKSSFHL